MTDTRPNKYYNSFITVSDRQLNNEPNSNNNIN